MITTKGQTILKANYVVLMSTALAFGHGLRTPNDAFFHKNPKLLGLGRQMGSKSLRHLGNEYK